MHQQNHVHVFEPDPTSEHTDERGQPRTEAESHSRAGRKKRSPLPSARQIDAAIEAKYGAPRYREIGS